MLHKFFGKISNTEFPLSCCLDLLIIYKKSVPVIFVEKGCQEVKQQMIIICKLEVPNILRIIVTYHFECQATAHNTGVWFSEECL